MQFVQPGTIKVKTIRMYWDEVHMVHKELLVWWSHTQREDTPIDRSLVPGKAIIFTTGILQQPYWTYVRTSSPIEKKMIMGIVFTQGFPLIFPFICNTVLWFYKQTINIMILWICDLWSSTLKILNHNTLTLYTTLYNLPTLWNSIGAMNTVHPIDIPLAGI